MNIYSRIFIFIVSVMFFSSTFALTSAEIYRIASPSIFTLYGVKEQKNELDALGSAVAVTTTILATNCHVALHGNYVVVKIANKHHIGGVIYTNRDRDLCLVEIPGASFQPAKLRDAASVEIGEDVYAIGNPNIYATGNPIILEKTLSKGIISNKNKNNMLQTDAPISPGSSGGGLFDSNAQLIGITTSGVSQGSIGFAIPSEWISRVVSTHHEETSSSNYVSLENDKKSESNLFENQKSNNSTPKKLIHLGTFGDDNVGLYRFNNNCYIYINGYDANHTTISSALWNPKHADRVYVFQNAKSSNETFAILNNEIIEKKGTYELKRIRSYLILKNVLYEFLGNANLTSNYPFMVVVIGTSPLSLFLEADYFIAQLKNSNSETGYNMVQFGLWGFSDAMAVYNTVCKQ